MFLIVVCCFVFVVCGSLFAGSSLSLCVVCCIMVRCFVSVACCVLCVVCCLLFVDRCLLVLSFVVVVCCLGFVVVLVNGRCFLFFVGAVCCVLCVVCS